jgi:hypothetical protein
VFEERGERIAITMLRHGRHERIGDVAGGAIDLSAQHFAPPEIIVDSVCDCSMHAPDT